MMKASWIRGLLIAAMFAGGLYAVAQTSTETSFAGRGARLVFGETPNERARTVLILGEAGPGWTAGDLTDTIILAIFQTDPGRATLLSLPRDLLVQLPSGKTEKINTLWEVGRRGQTLTKEQAALISSKVEEITGLAVDDVIVIDTEAVEKTIDALGGIAISVEEPIDDPAFPTPGGGIEHFTLEPGFKVLDGKTAVKYARTRHTSENDFGRLRRQHQVLQAMLAKAKGLHLIEDAPKLLALYEALNGHVHTTLSFDAIRDILGVARDLPASRIQTFALETLGPEPLLTGMAPAYLIPKEGVFSYEAIQKAIASLIK